VSGFARACGLSGLRAAVRSVWLRYCKLGLGIGDGVAFLFAFESIVASYLDVNSHRNSQRLMNYTRSWARYGDKKSFPPR
jgi:hypothetical protein